MRKEVKVLKDHADGLADLINIGPGMGCLDSIEPDFPCIGNGQPIDTAKKCTFPRSRWSDNHLGFSLLYLEGNTLENLFSAVGFVYILHL